MKTLLAPPKQFVEQVNQQKNEAATENQTLKI